MTLNPTAEAFAASAPLSVYQRRIWRGHLSRNDTSYVIPCVFDVSGPIDSTRLLAAVDAVVDGNPILRSAVVGAQDPRLIDTGTLPTPDDLGEARDDRHADEITVAQLRRPFTTDGSSPFTRIGLLLLPTGDLRVVIVFHHVVMDGVSMDLFAHDVLAEYQDPGCTSLVPRPQYTALDPAPRDRATAWWSSRFTSPPKGGEVWRAEDRSSGNTVIDRGRVGWWADVRARASGTGVLNASVWLAGVAATLTRIVDADVLCLGVPVANRRDLDEFDVIGPLVNVVPLVVTLNRHEPVATLVTRMDQQLRQAVDHADANLDAAMAAARECGAEPPTADVLVNIREADRPALSLGDITFTPVGTHSGDGKTALTVSLQTDTEGAECQIESALLGWDVDTHVGFRNGLEAFARTWLDSPATNCADVDMGVRGEVEQRHSTNTIVEAIRRHAETAPGAVALITPDGRNTWAELTGAIDAARDALADAGVRRGDCVLLSAERDLGFVHWAAGALALGAAYVPVDVSQGEMRLASVAGSSGAVMAVAPDDWHGFFSNLGLGVLPRGHVPTAPPSPESARPEDLAYILFTSGSTGVPKGVAVTQANVVALGEVTPHYIGPEDTVSSVHSFTFDYSVWEVWVALAAGARVVVLGPDEIHDPFLMAETVGDKGVSVLSLTNTAFGVLLTACAEPDAAAAVRRSVRRVVLGGESVSPEYVRGWREMVGPACEIVNMLGATETTVHTTERVLGPDDARRGVVSVGRALAHLDVVLLNDRGEALPLGVEGEIAVRGDGVSLGYIGRPGLTASRFVPDFTPTANGGRLYLTGDMGRWRSDNEAPPTLDCLGRRDTQVKVRGYRIELGGVERVLDSAPEVARSCALAHDGRLVAYVSLTTDASGLDTGTVLQRVQAHARERLASHEMPDDIHVVSGYPTTTTGKLDRNPDVLSAFVIAGQGSPSTTGAARSDVSASAQDVLLGVLPEENVDLGRPFIANGGDSIRAVEAVAAIRQLGHACAVADLLSNRPLREVVDSLSDGTPEAPQVEARLAPFALLSNEVRAALPADASDAYPLSAAQQGMLFHVEFDSEVGVYHNTLSVRIRGHLDDRAFRVAIDDTMRRHDVLRTSIDQDLELDPIQVVHRSVEVPFTYVDATGQDTGPVVEDLLDRERLAPFDLSKAPLFRMTLVKVADGENQLILSDSHIILDGWSWTSTLAEIIDRHNALVARDPKYDATTAPDEGVRFADFIKAELEARQDPVAEAAWQAYLADARPVSMTDRRGTGVRDVRRTPVDIDEQLDEALRQRATGEGVSLRHIAMAVHFKTVSDELGTSDLIAGVTTNGRLERPGGTDTRGMFLNMLPHRIRIVDDLGDLARACAEAEAAMAPHRRLPLIDIQQAMRRGPLFDHGFNFVRFHRLGNIEKSHTFASAEEAPHYSREDTDLAWMSTFSVHPPDHRLALMLIADADRVGSDRVQRLAAAYRANLVLAARLQDVIS